MQSPLLLSPGAAAPPLLLLLLPQVRTLQSVTDAALDEAGSSLCDWRLLEPNCQLRGMPRLMQACKVRPPGSTGWPLQ